jgi:serine/threonine protein phosphatase PrpC
MKNILNKNNTSNTVSISTNIDMPSNNNKIIDTYESTTIANINKHCDSLLSKINQKLKEKEMEKEKEKEKENSNGKENEFKEYNGYIEFEDNYNKIKSSEEKKNKVICKKIISNASLSRRGLNRPDEVMKINQDTLFKVKFGDINYSYYGVCDGHGPSGHFVSDFIKSNIAFIVYKHLKSLLLQNQNNNSSNLNEVDDSNIDFSKLFKDCFLLMDSKLSENKSIDIELSGTTCVSLLFCDNRIISANVGDSRAIKGQYNIKTNNWDYIALSRDHKPSEKDEAERIKKSKGIIHPYIDDDGNYAGPDRVWKDDELPGLAMSRSFGDEIASSVGVFSEPEVKIFPFNEEDKFIVIASDGLWEYVTNEEVTDIVSEYFEKKDCDGAVSKLYEISHERWVQYDDYIDDISIIVVFLE